MAGLFGRGLRREVQPDGVTGLRATRAHRRMQIVGGDTSKEISQRDVGLADWRDEDAAALFADRTGLSSSRYGGLRDAKGGAVASPADGGSPDCLQAGVEAQLGANRENVIFIM